ncbi:MAG: DEAD/DEAH box helicase [Methanomassiliicoccales archaeon]|nr:DEAD/DEAH box helicase [Methanomassiliicoccales archaeon]
MDLKPKDLRPYQQRTIATLRNMVTMAGKKRILAVGPTALGKMVLAASMIRSSTLPVLFVAHRRELLDQCADQLRGLGVTNVSIMRGNDERYDPNSTIQICSIQTLARRSKPFVGEKILIFIDEAHRAAADSVRENVFDVYPDAIVIGFTATPVRLDGRPLGGDLFEELLVIATYEELFKHPDWLARPDARSAPLKPYLDHVPVRGSDFDEELLAKAMSTEPLEGQIVDHWLKWSGQHRGEGVGVYKEGERRRTFVFAVNIAHSMSLAARFEKVARVAHLDGNTKETERKSILKALGSGELEVVCNCNIAVEGVDVPEVKCIVAARPTHSLTMHRQQSGRMMRPWKGVVPLLLDHAGNWDRLGCPWEDLSWSLKSRATRKSGLPMKLCKVCFAYCEPSRVICPYCGSEFPARDAREMPAETTTELIARQSEPDALKADFFARQTAMAKTHGYKPGFPSKLFKDRYGVWPPREWSDKVKAEFDKDVIWQDTMARRMKRKEEREKQEQKEAAAMGEAPAVPAATVDMEKMREAFRKVAPKSSEERAMESTLEAMDSDPWSLAPDSADAPFSDWINGELDR